MSLGLVFLLVLVVCFAFVVLFTRPSQADVAVQRRLKSLAEQERDRPTEGTILKQDRLSPTPWLDELLFRIPGTTGLLDLVKQAGSDWWVSSIVFGSMACAVGGGALTSFRFQNTAVILFSAIAFGFSPIAYLLLLRYRRLEKCDAQLPQAIELMSRALRAGHALPSAIEMASHDVPEPLAGEFRMVHEEQLLGLPMRDALMNLLDRIPRDDMRFLTTALLLQKETGGNLVQILDTTAHVMRERVRLRGQIRIYTAQARVTAWVVSLLPFAMFLLLNLANPGYENIMLNDPTGRTLVYIGLFMWTAGILAIRKLIVIKV
jgi:tight adherence protein B